jgi:hypothetical protein
LRLPTLEEICRENLGGEIIPRSVLLARFEKVSEKTCRPSSGIKN